MTDYEFGSDGQAHPVEKPLAPLVEAERKIEKPEPFDAFAANEPAAAAERLRAFEDAHLGPDAVRLHGRIERGSGSLFQSLPPEKQQAHAAIEKTVETERKLAAAHAALIAADAEHEAAVEDASRFGG